MVKDEKTGTCYHVDHLLKDFYSEKLQKDISITAKEAAELKRILAVLDDLSAEELGAKLKEYGITAPDTKNPFSDPYPLNLMFQTSIGPSGLSPGSCGQKLHRAYLLTSKTCTITMGTSFLLLLLKLARLSEMRVLAHILEQLPLLNVWKSTNLM
ncbi:glycine--tRNA ligase, mitochondrial 1-like [Humulus lupulus]|uniref:glycine--tRNA ligase, mitochondrial 1-like n=1 Tax=Humulus lupulus TaxID=3486 RepID=UPI002B409E43|nr:glycine--tRNA ligase, mitochondrial 1-like [Humulus lupulus]